LTLKEAAQQYLSALADEERVANQAELERFVRWCGTDRDFESLRGHDVANYAETLTGTVADASRRGEVVRAFLVFAKKAGFTPTNLGAHLRLKKGSAKQTAVGATAEAVHLTEDEKVAIAQELDSLRAQRPRIVKDIQRAMADKDFRENAPLDAARDQQAYIEGRIRKLEATLDHAVIVERARAVSGDAVDIGSTVLLHNLQNGAEITYTLVHGSEANAAQGRISYDSPVGKALLQRRAGDEVEVTVPSGTLRLRVERVDA
jgi:transcription elongation factor GreA